MSLPLGTGVSYGKSPAAGHAVNVSLARYDFYDPSSMTIYPNDIPHPDAYDEDVFNTTLPRPSQRGYLGCKARFDIGNAMRSQGMNYVQSVYIDNSNGLGVLILKSSATGIAIAVPPCSQGVYPLVVPLGSNNTYEVAYIDPDGDDNNTIPSFAQYPDVSTDFTGGGGVWGTNLDTAVKSGFVNFQFLDIVMPIGQWSCRNLVTARWLDYSAAIGAGGVFQTALTGNPYRKGFIVGNPITAVEPLFVALHMVFAADSAVTSIALQPGQHYKEVLPEPIHIASVRVMAPSPGTVVMVKEKF